jgi:predicted cupin superfamily sugar epimerase
MTARELIARLNLAPHPREGGYYRESYRSPETLPATALPPRFGGDRAMSTAIYYVLTPGSVSRLHRLKADEVWHFYLGDPVTMLLLHADGSGQTVTFGHDIAHDQCVQFTIPAGTWIGTRLHPGERWALLGVTVAPGFEFADFELGEREALLAQYPAWRDAILALTLEKNAP